MDHCAARQNCPFLCSRLDCPRPNDSSLQCEVDSAGVVIATIGIGSCGLNTVHIAATDMLA